MRSKIIRCFLIVSIGAISQTREIDSLKQIINTLNDDTNKVNKFNNLSNEFNINEFKDSSFNYAYKAKALSEKLGFKKGIAKSYMHIGLFYQKMGNSPEAIKNYFEGAKIWEQIGGMAGHAHGSYANIGGIYGSLGNYEEALKNWKVALKISKQMDSKESMALDYHYIGQNYLAMNNYSEAQKNNFEALNLRKDLNDKWGMGSSYNNIGNVYFSLDNYEEALQSYNLALNIWAELGDSTELSRIYGNIGNVFEKHGDLDDALTYYLESLKIQELVNDGNVAWCYNKIIKIYNKQKKYKEAERDGNYALLSAKDMDVLHLVAELNQTLSETYVGLGNARKAVDCYQTFIAARDSLKNEESAKKAAKLASNFEFDKKEMAAKLIQDEKDLRTFEEKKKQKIIIWSVCSILLLVFTLTIFIFRGYKQKQKANNELAVKNATIERQKQDVEEKQKEILDSIHYAKRIQRSMMPSERLIEKNMKKLKKL